jgi:CRISPR/Cas system-associated protein endoribonuclease Cas2
MKRIIIFAVLFSIPVLIRAQNGPVDKLFDKYSGKDGFTTVYISKYMFDMFRTDNAEDKEADELNKVLGKLTAIKILTVEDPAFIGSGVNFYDEIMKELPREKYNELMVVKDKESDVVFLAREEKGIIVELLLIAGGSDVSDNVLISIQGQIDLETISKLSKTLDIEGMESLEKIDE